VKVLHVIPQFSAGGAEVVASTLVREQLRRGHDVALATEPGFHDADLRDLPVRRFGVRDRGRSILGAGAAAGSLARAVAAVQPDVVHAHNVKATALAAVGGRLARRPAGPVLVSSFQGIARSEDRRAALIFRGAHEVACVSRDLADRLRACGFPQTRISVVENAIEPALPLDPADREALDAEFGLRDGGLIVSVARLVPQKAHHRLLEAAVTVRDAHPGARLLIVGDGPLRAELERHAAELSLDGFVRFTGLRRDTRRLIARADVVAFSSDWEGMSLAALEALAAGVPVVSTPAEGMRDLLGSGAGLLAAGFEAPALAASLLEALESPARRAAMGARGKALVEERFGVGRMADAYDAIYARRSERPR
jgi:glycosyltransferase involved in cell wall biosynthesis